MKKSLSDAMHIHKQIVDTNKSSSKPNKLVQKLLNALLSRDPIAICWSPNTLNELCLPLDEVERKCATIWIVCNTRGRREDGLVFTHFASQFFSIA